MDLTGVHQTPAAPIADLAAWDWKGELKAQERSLEWLARRTDRSLSTVNSYSQGRIVPPASWLEAAAHILGVKVATDA